MKTTIVLDDGLMKELRKSAAETGRTMTSIIEDALRQFLAPSKLKKAQRISVPTFGGGSLLPGVDLDSNAGLLDLMESDLDRSGR